jgi:hypothetical protein
MFMCRKDRRNININTLKVKSCFLLITFDPKRISLKFFLIPATEILTILPIGNTCSLETSFLASFVGGEILHLFLILMLGNSFMGIKKGDTFM